MTKIRRAYSLQRFLGCPCAYLAWEHGILSGYDKIDVMAAVFQRSNPLPLSDSIHGTESFIHSITAWQTVAERLSPYHQYIPVLSSFCVSRVTSNQLISHSVFTTKVRFCYSATSIFDRPPFTDCGTSTSARVLSCPSLENVFLSPRPPRRKHLPCRQQLIAVPPSLKRTFPVL
ncbi:hypothetical protein BDY19DRAFT_178944 [Irpex rosettiformis]|uniref:Uncharacterized protein n=1 Tax=Irpex rosettiformis TaxID=378272 RepID=A0ACB8U337_9APHY|nr:hypothetical protein BDY19DRAFT_178944 [Irpex rosettiformis]